MIKKSNKIVLIIFLLVLAIIPAPKAKADAGLTLGIVGTVLGGTALGLNVLDRIDSRPRATRGYYPRQYAPQYRQQVIAQPVYYNTQPQQVIVTQPNPTYYNVSHQMPCQHQRVNYRSQPNYNNQPVVYHRTVTSHRVYTGY